MPLAFDDGVCLSCSGRLTISPHCTGTDGFGAGLATGLGAASAIGFAVPKARNWEPMAASSSGEVTNCIVGGN